MSKNLPVLKLSAIARLTLVTARQTLASVAERAKQGGYYSGARTDIINAHADLRAALDMLVKAAGPGGRTSAASTRPPAS